MARITQRMLDLMGKTIAQDWEMARERLKRAAHARQGASFGEILVYEGPPTPTGMVLRAFTGIVTWLSSAEAVSHTAFLAMPAAVGFADLMSETDFEQLRKMACRDYAGVPYDPAST
jgi:hypothetical protein